jgi:hypothetical protein
MFFGMPGKHERNGSLDGEREDAVSQFGRQAEEG